MASASSAEAARRAIREEVARRRLRQKLMPEARKEPASPSGKKKDPLHDLRRSFGEPPLPMRRKRTTRDVSYDHGRGYST